MQYLHPFVKFVLPAVLVVAGHGVASGAESSEVKYYRAYYLEHAEGDFAKAAELYAEVADEARGDNRWMADSARRRLAACREALASSDFAALMPPHTLAYVEIKRPGDRVLELLTGLGLVAKEGDLPAEGGKRVAVSPALVKELIGIRGAAVALTGFDPFKQMPSGVVVFDPGNLEVIRGMIETGLPIGGKPEQPIQNFPTYSVEGQAYITLTPRLVIIGTERAQIDQVVERLKGRISSSLANSDGFARAVEDRDDSFLFFYVNAEPVMPMLNTMMAGAGTQNREIAMAQALLDLNALQSLMGNLGVTEKGVVLEMALRLDEGHHNLVFNFLRTPPISRETLTFVPEDAAAVMAGALNEASARYKSAMSADPDAKPIVTFLDFGREVFANIISMAVFVLPPDGEPSPSPIPIPDVAAAVTVHDPAKSQALWAQVLGVATMASGAPGMEGVATEMYGNQVRTYNFANMFSIHFATVENNVLMASSESAMRRAIEARARGRSILDSDAFGDTLANLTANTTRAVIIHAGRCVDLAERFAPMPQAMWMKQIKSMLTKTTASLMVEHSDNVFHIAARVSGIPDVGELANRMLNEQMASQERRSRLSEAKRSGNWDEALAITNESLQKDPGNVSLLQTKFHILAVGKNDEEAAHACAGKLFKKMHESPLALNNFAWALLTEDQYKKRYDDVALEWSRRSNELTSYKNWAYVDTLALAEFRTGNVEKAVKLQKKAVELANGRGGKAVTDALAKYEAALKESEQSVASTGDSGGSG